MIFVKKMTTLAKLNKAKEDMMVEIVKREMGKMHMTALALKWLHSTNNPCSLKNRLHAQGVIRKHWRSYRVFRKFKDIWVEYKTFGKIKPIAEGYALGFQQRKRFAPRKAQAIEDGLFEAGGSSLVKRKKKKPSKAAAPVDFTKFAEVAAANQTPEQKAANAKKEAAHAAAVEQAEAEGRPPPPPPKVTCSLGPRLPAGALTSAVAARRSSHRRPSALRWAPGKRPPPRLLRGPTILPRSRCAPRTSSVVACSSSS